MQYSISNLNAFILLVTIGYSLYCYVNDNDNDNINLKDRNNSPIQLISQLRGYFFINPVLALSLTITLFSFVGVPPLIGFFAKQMVLSAALDNGYIFMALVAILTSVISAVYYLAVIKQIFFDKPNYKLNPYLEKSNLTVFISKHSDYNINDNYENDTNVKIENNKVNFNASNIVLSGSLSGIISILTLIILLFIFIPQE
jgi:NADH-ubiquinone oxidoreductase chain 2